MDLVGGSLDLFAAAIIGVLLVGALLKGKHPKPFGNRIIALLVGHMIGLLCDSILWFWSPELLPHVNIATAVAVQRVGLLISYGMLIGMTIIYTDCLVKYIKEKSPVPKQIVPFVIVGCAGAFVLWVISIFNGSLFTFDARGMFVATKHYWISHGLVTLFLCVDMLLILQHRKALGLRQAVSLTSYTLLPIIGFVLSFWWDVVPIYVAATLSLLLMFIVFHLEQDKQLQEQERQLTQNHISVMLGQIQPHFLYNTLTAICGLCDENPCEAKRVTAEFADYLRHNLESLSQSTAVSFSKELRHTEVYLNIEKKRFEDKLNIVYHIETTSFCIPSLTLQPLVENAVRHGVTKKVAGGTITLSTRECEDCYEITVADDGVGFDPEVPHLEPTAHIGIENVRNRLWAICRAVLTISSRVEAGTVATITIPKSVDARRLRADGLV